jgi:hypothetical protein
VPTIGAYSEVGHKDAREAAMTTSHAEMEPVPSDVQRELEEIIRAKQPRPIETVEDFIVPGLFDSDEEVDEFIAFTHAERRANLG